MLGLIRGRSAGETNADPGPLMLPRFLLPLAPLASCFVSFSSAPGVEAVIGDPTIDGLAILDCGRADDGVLDGPSFGVLRADRRGVSSFEFEF